jgi:hypothetical protein
MPLTSPAATEVPVAGLAAMRADGTWQQINDRWTHHPVFRTRRFPRE